MRLRRSLMCSGLLLALLLLAATALAGNASEPAPLKLLTHSGGDQVYRDAEGNLRGKEHGGRRAFNVELVREMMQIVGQDHAIEEVPFKRGFMMVQSQAGHALFNVNRTASREKLVKWVGPLQSSTTHLYENKNAPTGVTTLEEAKQASLICVLRDNVHHRYLKKQGFTNIFAANSYANCAQMLINQRASLTPLSNISTLTMNNQSQEERILQQTPVQLSESKGYLTFSPVTSREVIATWQNALDQIKASGRYQELFNLYLRPE